MKTQKTSISRRKLLKGIGFVGVSATLAACTAPSVAPKAVAPTTAPSGATAAAPTPIPAPTITPVPLIPQPVGSTKLSFWYGLGGNLGNVVRQVVNKYNQSQSNYYVEAVFQASYEDTINKINTSLAGGELPNVVQIFDAGQQRMIDSKRVRVVQDLLKADGMGKFMDDLEPAVRSYYTVGDTMYCMPFNSSTAMTYFNKNALKEVGLDTEKKIYTYNELIDAAKKMTKKSGDKIERTGLAFNASGWFFEQQHAVHNELMGVPDNGRTTRATQYTWNTTKTGAAWFELLKKMVDEGGATYYASANPQAAFVSGQAAIHFDSIAALRGITASAEKNGIDVGVAYMPRMDGAEVGRTIIGGAAIWLTDAGTPEQQAGGWDFVKFATTTETQGFWSANTGYYPVRQSSYETADMKEALAKYPQFNVAIEQIRSAPISHFNSGIISGTFVPMRQEVQKAMDLYWSGKASVKEALDTAASKANEQLEEYNSTVKA